MFVKTIILCAASASFLYSAMYAAVSSYYDKQNNRSAGATHDSK